jgi:hypothetical protein
MSILKNSGIKNHRSASRGNSRREHRTAGRQLRSGFPMIEPGLRGANQRPFVEDFNLEHSLSRISIAQIAISARAGVVKTSTPVKNYAYDLNSPNCVYIG